MSTSLYNVSDTIINCNTEITTIHINNQNYNQNYKITKNIKLNLYFCKIEPYMINNKSLEDRINIILSNTNNLTIENITKIILVCSNPYKNKDIVYNEDKYNIFNITNQGCKYKHNKSLLYNKFFNNNKCSFG